MQDIIKIDGLYKSFKEVKAVQNLSFKVKKGQLFAFLGVNGAGKSTTISIMCGQLKKDNGKIFINGIDLDENIDKIKRDLGVVFQSSVLDKQLTVKENLQTRAVLYGIFGDEFEKRFAYLAKTLDFEDFINRPVGKLSGGQRRRIDIARAVLHNPKILILDEPTTGLDPQTRTLIWRLIASLREKENMTVFLTTHYMEEASEADFVVILDGGKIVAEGTPIALKNEYAGDTILLYGVDESAVAGLNLPYKKIVDGYKILVSSTAEATKLILENPTLFTDYEIIKGKMDEVFLSVTGKRLQEVEA